LAAVAGWWLAVRTIDLKPADTLSTSLKIQDTDKRIVHLYFSDVRGRNLRAEQRAIRTKKDEVHFGHLIVEELIQGPQAGGARTLPKDSKIRAFFILKPGTAYIDFDTEAFDSHPGGVGNELLSVYSVVNSLILNSDVIRSVKFLIGGQEATTLAGHLDISRPITANMLLIR
jgi:hypothetical protein